MKTSIVLLVVLILSSLLGSPELQGNDGQAKSSPGFTVGWIGSGSLTGDASDRSGLTGMLDGGIPENRLGGFSAIDFLGGDEWLVLSDRGPADGATEYACRFHRFRLKIDPTTQSIVPTLLDTTLLLHPSGNSLMGSLNSLQREWKGRSLAIDPEGLRILPTGDLLLSDEYGPSFDRFHRSGKWAFGWQVPSEMLLHSDPTQLSTGTAPNRGMEGLALSHDGKSVIGAMQGPLIQDSREERNKRVGLFTRLLRYPVESRDSSLPIEQWIYPLDDPICGISEILALDEHRYLVIERDGLIGSQAKFKRIYCIDTKEATNIASNTKIEPMELPRKIQAVKKSLVIDLLDSAYGFTGDNALVKPEGLAWGPELQKGVRTLIVCVDNDFQEGIPSRFLAFSIRESDPQDQVPSGSN